MTKITDHNRSDSAALADKQLDHLLAKALPEPLLPGHLQQQILREVGAHAPAGNTVTVIEQALIWLLGDSHWWRAATAGLATLVLGYVIGLSNPSGEALEDSIFEASNLITLNEAYEDYNDPL